VSELKRQRCPICSVFCKNVPYTIAPRRTGDIAKCFADLSYAKEVLDWSATKNIHEMCEDSWKWQSMNPNGYK